MENIMAMRELTIKIYRRIGRKRYLNGKYVYEYERIYVPIPTLLQEPFRAMLKGRVKIRVIPESDEITIKLRPDKSFRHAESPPDKT